MSARLPAYVHLNGRLVPAARARISIFDRGLLYADGLFETLRAYRGRVLALDEHLQRLKASAAFLSLQVPRRPWARDARALLEKNGLLRVDARVRLTLTRGVAAPGLTPPARHRPTVIITAARVDTAIAMAQQGGVDVSLVPFSRQGVLAEHKTLAYLPAVLARSIAARDGAFEGLYVEGERRVTEGATSNVFIWYRNQLLTPGPHGVLPGVTRRLVLQLAAANGIRVREAQVTVEQLHHAEEAFLTSSVVEIVPLRSVNGQPVGTGEPGPLTRRLQALYRRMVDQMLTER